MPEDDLKPLGWVGDSKEVMQSFPKPVRTDLGYALDQVQRGLDPPSWKPRNDVGPGAIQIMAEDKDGWYRVFFVAKFEEGVFVLHAFQKKTNETSRADIANGKEAYASLKRHLEKQGTGSRRGR